MTKTITGCVDCPFKYEYDMAIGYGCKMDTNNRTIKQSKKFQPIDPDWCPLKTESITIQLKINDN